MEYHLATIREDTALLIALAIVPVCLFAGWWLTNNWPERRSWGKIERRGFPVILKNRNSGFSFTEVLFAVIILGIGFIFIAAIFPVALKQQQLTTSEGRAAGDVRKTVEAIKNGANSTNFPYYPIPAKVIPVPASFNGVDGTASYGVLYSHYDDRLTPATRAALWNIAASANVPGERASAFFYQRNEVYRNPTTTVLGSNSPLVSRQIDSWMTVTIVMLDHGGSTYSTADVRRWPVHDTSITPATIEGKPLLATTVNGPEDTITFSAISASRDYRECLGPGALVIVSDDAANGVVNGRIYRLGTRRSDLGPNAWEMAPGQDMTSSTEDMTDGIVFVVGRPWANPALPGTFEGVPQEVSFYVTVVPVR